MNEQIRQAMIQEQQTRTALAQASPDDATAYEEAMRAHQDAQQSLIGLLENYQETPPPAELVDRVELHRYLHAYTENRSVDGAEAEMNREMGLSVDNQVPIQALLDREAEQDRADAATTVDGVRTSTQPIASRIFGRTDLGFLGVPMPSVPAGTARFPFLTAGASGVLRKEGVAVDATKATFRVEEVNPVRITARYLWGVESAAQVGAELEAVLRSDLRETLGNSLDDLALVGSYDDKQTKEPEFKGIVPLLGTATQVNGADKATAATYAKYRSSVYDQLDGEEYQAEEDVRLLIGLDTYKAARAVYFGTQTPLDAIAAMRQLGASVRYSAHIASASAATNTDGSKQTAIYTVRPDSLVVPVWSGITLIRDPYTQAANGQIALTAHMLFGIGIRRGKAATGSISGWKALEYVISNKS